MNNANWKKYVLNVYRILIIVFATLAVISLAIIGIIFFSFYNGENISSEAVITAIEGKDVFVTYTVDGSVYENIRYFFYSSGMKIGDSVGILYNPENPGEILFDVPWFFAIFLVFPVNFSIIAIVFTVISVNVRKSFNETYYPEKDTSAVPDKFEGIDGLKKYRFEKNALKDEWGRKVAEIKRVKFGLIGPSVFELTNLLSGHRERHSVGIVIRIGGMGSFFSLDGNNCWNYLKMHGINIKAAGSSSSGGRDVVVFHGEDPIVKMSLNALSGRLTDNSEVEAAEGSLDEVMLTCFCFNRSSPGQMI